MFHLKYMIKTMVIPPTKYILEFYFTIGIPLLYVGNLWAITSSDSLTLTPTLQLIGLLLAAIGIVFWIVSYINLGASFGVLPKTQTTVQRGIYSAFNHPMYLGITYTFFGLSIANRSYTGLLFSLLITTPILVLRGLTENRKLIMGNTKFGTLEKYSHRKPTSIHQA